MADITLLNPRCAGANIPGPDVAVCPRCGATPADPCGDSAARTAQEKAYQASAAIKTKT